MKTLIPLSDLHPLKIYLVSQDVNKGYDTFDAFVVVAENEQRAKELTLPDQGYDEGNWAPIEDLQIKCIGTALDGAKEEIVLGSYNGA